MQNILQSDNLPSIMLTYHIDIDSWFSSVFSDVRKIITHISTPVLITQ